MARYYLSKEVDCPFYKGEDGKELFCEGITDKMKVMRLSFGSVNQMKAYRKAQCGECWKQCRLAEILLKKYD